jgi:ABC-type nitrate/sulfonate/bicarbonate transport system permease component
MTRVAPTVFIIAFLAAWETFIILLAVPEYILPKPSVIALRLFTHGPALLPHFGVTALEAASGFLLGAAFGVTLSIVFVHVAYPSGSGATICGDRWAGMI